MGKTKKERKYFKKQKIQHRHNKRLKFIPMSVATCYDFFIWADLKGPRWRTRRRERRRAFQSILRHYADKCVADDLPTLDYHYKYDVPSYTDYICNHTYSDGKTAIIFNEDDNTYQCSLCGKKFCAVLENANKNYDSKTEVKEARVIQESEPMELRSERNNNEQEE